MKQQILFSFAFFLLMFFSLYSPNIAATVSAPAASPKQAPSPKASSPTSSKPLVPTLPTSPDTDSTPDDVTKILKKAKSFTILTRLLKTTEIMSNINSQLITEKSGGGLTILAPDDSAFSHLKAGFLNSLDENKKIELLQFHILPQFVDSNNFDSLSNPVETVAGKDSLKLPLNVESFGNNVNLSTGVVNATVTGVVYQDNKLAIYSLDKVLIPLDFVGTKAPASAPVAAAKAPKGDKEKSSSGDDGGDDETTQDKKDSGAVRLLGIEGTMLVSVGVAFVVVTMFGNWI